MSATTLPPSRLRPADTWMVGSLGLRTRRLRTALSALGVSIGIAAMVAVLGLSESSRADLLSDIEALGANLLTVAPSTGFGAGDGVLPEEAAAMISRIGPVVAASSVHAVEATVLRNDVMNPSVTGGLSVVATDVDLLATLNGSLASGRFLDDANDAFPVTVLGSVAAERLGVASTSDGVQVFIGDQWFTVIGVLEQFPLAEDLDRAALIGLPAATELFGTAANASTIYVQTTLSAIDAVRDVLPATADPTSPEEVAITRPSDVLEAQAAADSAFTSLFLGLGAVALLVGGIGIANVMVIAVIERRNEIGLRRALGATAAHIRRQFLTESLILSALGGLTGVAIGAATTAAYATFQGWQIVLPTAAAVGGFGAAIVIGGVAGLYPAMRAARLTPTEALRGV